MSKQERLEKDVVDTYAAYVWHKNAADLWNAAVAADVAYAAYAAYDVAFIDEGVLLGMLGLRHN
tara:strand:+ start:239 stop:430 length:192 start_codon:yes stop_codon:yes gene_type:complete